MKRNNVAKRFGIASLCLVTALSAFSGIASQKSDVALADGEIAVTDFVYTTAETVTPQTKVKTKSDGSTTATGLRLSSNSSYMGMFKTVFTGNTTLNFKFPEEFNTTTREYYGDFTIHIADVDDDSNYFDIVYYASQVAADKDQPNTSVSLKYVTKDGKKLTRSSKYHDTTIWYTSDEPETTGQTCAPNFLSYNYTGSKNGDPYKMGYLELNWTDDVLTVWRPGLNRTKGPLGAFDGTYNPEAWNNGFKNGTSWGLPKLEGFKDGYTITFSSNISKYIVKGDTDVAPTTTDTGTDVFLTSITDKLGGAVLYDLSKATVAVDDGMTNFENTFGVLTTQEVAAGKAFLGWKNTATNALYPANSLVKKSDSYEAVIINYDTINGASVKVDTTGSKSGIRFMTAFNIDEYAAVEQYITERGTLVAVTSALDASKDFTIANYKDVIATDGNVKKVRNDSGVFDYKARNGTTYKAYSIAITFENVSSDYYAIAFSTRGYFVLRYTNGSAATIYTDYDAKYNSRSIAQTAYKLRAAGTEYNRYTQAQKAIVDKYADCYNANQ